MRLSHADTGLGQTASPSVIDSLMAEIQSLLGHFLQMESDLLRAQSDLMNAIRVAESKQQGTLVSQLESLLAKQQTLIIQYRSAKAGVTNALSEAGALKSSLTGGLINLIQFGSRAIALIVRSGPVLREARRLMFDIPRFVTQVRGQVGRAQVAPVADPGTPGAFEQITTTLQKIPQAMLMGAVITGSVILGSRLLPQRRRRR